MRYSTLNFLQEHAMLSLNSLTLASGKYVMLSPIPNHKLPLLLFLSVTTATFSTALKIKC